MFVARSAARVRLARLVFLVLGFAPAACIVAWAVHRRSDAHRTRTSTGHCEPHAALAPPPLPWLRSATSSATCTAVAGD